MFSTKSRKELFTVEIEKILYVFKLCELCRSASEILTISSDFYGNVSINSKKINDSVLPVTYIGVR